MAGNKSFMTSLLDLLDDNNFMNNIMSKHSSTKQVDVKDYLSLVKKILDPKGDQVHNKSSTSLSPVSLSPTINELCWKITCEALHTNNAGQTMELLFAKLSSFSWDVKAVLTLSAFSVYYAEHRGLAQMEESDYYLGLAAALRGPRAGKLDFGALKDLIRETLYFTEYTVDFANSKEFAASRTSIEASFYQIILGVIGCSVTFSGMICTRHEFPGQDLSTFADRVTKKYESFKKQVENLREEHEEKRQYEKLKDLYTSPSGIVKLVAEMCCTKNDSLTVNQGLEKTTVKVDQLQNKNVMLLISELSLSDDDLETLNSIYNDGFKSSNYEIMWVPIADVKDDEHFQKKRSKMRWYSCNSIVSKAAAKFIRKWWKFKQQTKVVVLNEKGEVENTDAMSMIRLWGLKALPFTQKQGDKLLEELGNNWLNLVVNDTWERTELILLHDSAEDSDIVRQIKKILSSNTYTSNFKFININNNRKQFLSRLENCITWKMRVKREMPDSLTLKMLELYTSYQKQSGFTIVARGSSVMVNTSLTDLLKVLSDHKEWIKEGSNTKDFETLFLEYFKKVIPMPQCYQLSIPNMVDDIPKCIKCPTDNCTWNMETVVTFKCCHGEH